MSYATRFDSFGYPVLQGVIDLKKADGQTDDTSQILFRPDQAAQLLQNDSLSDISKRGKLYHSLLAFVVKIGTHNHTRSLVTETRFAKKGSPGLAVLSSRRSDQDQNSNQFFKGKGKGAAEEVQLLEVERSEDTMALSRLQASEVSKKGSADASGQDMLALARRVTQFYEVLKLELVEGATSRVAQTPSSSADWAEYNAAHQVEYTNGVMASTRVQSMVQHIRASPRQRLRKITMELAHMTTSLPENIFVNVQEERPDVMKCLIIEPSDTPYEGGIFESTSTRFDILCDKDHPYGPPKVAFLTHDNSRVRFNPNLHRDGNVCLSLLGTRPGQREEQWQPRQSTMFQVLVSIQAMIFNDERSRNELAAD
ncbi:hypothetical protein MMC26_004639 [Xylographa opegraphella]|nr:hypothetical protein [Xylographa opegraphella]